MSEALYEHAENILLEELNFGNFKLPNETKNIRKFQDSFLTSNRLDAEYYQPKYEAYKKLVYDYPNGFQTVKAACNLKDRNFIPTRNSTYKYVELSDIGKGGQILSSTVAEGSELPSRARRKINTNDVVVSSIEGSLESCALVSNEYDNSICSTGFYVLSSAIINSETLLLLFKSVIFQNILKQHCSGTILTAINKFEFLSMPLPIIKIEIQKKLASIVKESFLLRKESDRLVELAKKSIELAIEKGEGVASEFVKSKL